VTAAVEDATADGRAQRPRRPRVVAAAIGVTCIAAAATLAWGAIIGTTTTVSLTTSYPGTYPGPYPPYPSPAGTWELFSYCPGTTNIGVVQITRGGGYDGPYLPPGTHWVEVSAPPLPAGHQLHITRRWFRPTQVALVTSGGKVLPLHRGHPRPNAPGGCP
jgi:hypothetical protein